ncbi:MAG TPA: DUF488 domain-containing protein [Solirubrobacteraceae bacterium]|nr:DUF488 domain-containing protein [Solirubrobacteraceae bacterium]
MSSLTVATVGVYGASLDSFLTTLADADVRLVIDVRQRRGVRGREYAWANSLRLQAALEAASIEYRHHRELAPTTELRHLQYREDARLGEGKRSRSVLAPEYTRRYLTEILDRVDMDAFAASLPTESTSALLCVERDARACHRSLIAARLAREHGARIVDLLA